MLRVRSCFLSQRFTSKKGMSEKNEGRRVGSRACGEEGRGGGNGATRTRPTGQKPSGRFCGTDSIKFHRSLKVCSGPNEIRLSTCHPDSEANPGGARAFLLVLVHGRGGA